MRAKTKRHSTAGGVLGTTNAQSQETLGSLPTVGESHARSWVRVTPEELGNQWWESKIKFFLITSCKK